LWSKSSVERIARRGYEAVGLDKSLKMLEYLSKKAKEESLNIETVRTNLEDFKLNKKVDFAFIMMGSLNVESNEKFLKHLDSLATSLNKRGLYFIKNYNVDWSNNKNQSWILERNGVKVRTTFECQVKDILSQIETEKITFEKEDNGRKENIFYEKKWKIIFPQEFKTLVKLNGKF
jgi:2-polyprenyl-3-methyl-5-hydroxy-6-metoxy-1,4-benzoquinol methylase